MEEGKNHDNKDRPKTPKKNMDISYPSPLQLKIKEKEIQALELKSGRSGDREVAKSRVKSIFTNSSQLPTMSARRRLKFETEKRPVTPFKAFPLSFVDKKEGIESAPSSSETTSEAAAAETDSALQSD